MQAEFDAFAQSSAQRRLPLAQDHVLAFPIEVILPGWRMFFRSSPKPFPCEVDYWWSFGDLTRSKRAKVTLVLPAIPPDSLPVLEPAPLIKQLPGGSTIPITATMESQVVRSTEEDLIFSVVRLDPACDRPEAWACASVEWIRLPMLGGEPTVVYSHFRAGVRRPQAGVGEAQPSVLPRQLKYSVSEALRDPRSGALLPGAYVVRLAMAFLSPTPEGRPEMLLARSRHWTIQVHAPGQLPEAVPQPGQPSVR
jgi:hypothetical protein